MQIELLTSPGCPNAVAAKQTITDALATLGMDAPIIERIGRYPSPTVLVDGVDVMRPDAGAPIGDACRLDLPTPQRVLDALRAHEWGAPQSVAAAAQQLPPAIRELHRAVLRGFRDHGLAHRDDLRPTAAELEIDLDDALHRLASTDLVHTTPDGQIEIAYPFSGRPTSHTVHLTGHPPIAAMCAIDALGIPLMTGTDGIINSTDPDTGTPIHIQHRQRMDMATRHRSGSHRPHQLLRNPRRYRVQLHHLPHRPATRTVPPRQPPRTARLHTQPGRRNSPRPERIRISSHQLNY